MCTRQEARILCNMLRLPASGAGGVTFAPEKTFTTAAASAPKFLLKNANTQEVIAQSAIRDLGALNIGDSIQPDFSITEWGNACAHDSGKSPSSLLGNRRFGMLSRTINCHSYRVDILHHFFNQVATYDSRKQKRPRLPFRQTIRSR